MRGIPNAAIRDGASNDAAVKLDIIRTFVEVCHPVSGIAASWENIYWTDRKACLARWNMENKEGLCLEMMGERSLNPLSDSRMSENFATISSINGRFAGLTCVISAIRSCMNSKPPYF
jgi:hypothetical protein